MASLPQLKPLGVGEVLDVGIKLYLRNFWTLFRIVFFIVAPLEFLLQAIIYLVPDDSGNLTVDEAGNLTTTTISLEAAIALAVAFGLIYLLAQVIATAASYKAIADAYLGAEPTWKGSLGLALRKLHSIIWVGLLSGLLIALGLIACFVPGIWLYGAFIAAIPVLMMEDIRGSKALGRSKRLVSGRWWPTFGIIVIGGIIGGIVSTGITAIEGAVATSGSDLASYLVASIGDTASAVVTVPLTACFITVLYIDLRVRKEGFDLQLLADRLGVPAPELAGSAAPLQPSPPAQPTPPASEPPNEGEQPPYWPPPPGWQPPKPESGDES